MTANGLPELDLDRWRARSASEQDAVVAALVAGPLGQAFAAGGAIEGPTRITILVERASGIPFHLVPGGRLRMGLGEDEARSLIEGLERRATHEPSDDLEAARDLVDRAAFMRPVHEVVVPPFLLAATPLTASSVQAILGGPAPEALGDAAPIAAKHLEAVRAAIEARGLRLPSEAEWEYAYRAGTATPFPWGDIPPTRPAAPRNAFGFAAMGFSPELCADTFHSNYDGAPADGSAWTAPPGNRIARGGAAMLFPWQGTGELLMMLSAFRSVSTEHGDFLAIRPAKSLG